ncbi:MAG: MFS transporter [Clostridiales bacterium]|jgi:Na+/melibiose symporter-like transporter|nr:MFS transporter [Clostridiales bacterium]
MAEKNELGKRERFIFAAADIWGGGGQTVVSVLYLVFLTNVLGVRPGLAGTTLMLVKVWDAVIDPVLGVLEDNTRTRWGRRRPYLMFGGAALLMAMALLWLPVRFNSEFAQVAFILVSNIFYATVASSLAIAYSSMSTEITTDFVQRNKANMTRLVFSMSASAVCSLLPTVFFDMLVEGALTLSAFYLIVVVGFGLVFTLPILMAGIFCRERAPCSDEKERLNLRALAAPLRVRAFRRLVALYLTQTVTMDTVSTVVIYYAMYVVPGISSTIFLGIFLVMQLVMFPLLNRLVNRVSKTRLYRFGLPLSILGAVGIGLYPASWPAAGVYALTALTALGFAGAVTLNWVIYPDIVDIGELVDGRRNAGSYSATMSFIRQLSSAFTIFMVGNALELSGFISPTDAVPSPLQPVATLWAIRLIIILVFVLLAGNGWRVAGRLKLNPETAGRVKYFLAKRHAGGQQALSDAERGEYEALVREYR